MLNISLCLNLKDYSVNPFSSLRPTLAKRTTEREGERERRRSTSYRYTHFYFTISFNSTQRPVAPASTCVAELGIASAWEKFVVEVFPAALSNPAACVSREGVCVWVDA